MNIVFEIIKISHVAAERMDYATVVFRVEMPKKVDADTSKDIWIYFSTLVRGGARKICADMKKVEYIDSSGIGVIINTAKLLRKQKGDIVLANVSADVREIFKVINLDNFIRIFGSEAEAMNAFRYIG